MLLGKDCPLAIKMSNHWKQFYTCPQCKWQFTLVTISETWPISDSLMLLNVSQWAATNNSVTRLLKFSESARLALVTHLHRLIRSTNCWTGPLLKIHPYWVPHRSPSPESWAPCCAQRDSYLVLPHGERNKLSLYCLFQILNSGRYLDKCLTYGKHSTILIILLLLLLLPQLLIMALMLQSALRLLCPPR